MSARRTILWISDGAAPANVRKALPRGYELTAYDPARPLAAQLSAARLAVIYPNGASQDPAKVSSLLGELEHTPAVAVLMLPDDASRGWQAVAGRSGQFLCVRGSASAEELSAKLAAAEALQPAIGRLQDELASARKLAKSPSGRIEEMNEEMRLAARLQRDFLPRRMPEVGPARFAVMYRPASWVSGDIYDVTRLDETHVGFYVADAVGHGMPAALLTMFIKHALQTKRIVDHSYQIVPPDVSLSELNIDICRQELSSCQFCTAVYAVLDVADMTLTYARAGHPPPVLIRAGGKIEYLDAPGSLLGIFEQEKYESRRVKLAPGDRLVVFTDGAEEAMRSAVHDTRADFGKLILPLAGATREQMLLELTGWIDQAPVSPNGDDDVTVMVLDIEGPGNRE